jgi:hypothetical protein
LEDVPALPGVRLIPLATPLPVSESAAAALDRRVTMRGVRVEIFYCPV